MNTFETTPNLLCAWIGILLGIVSGAALGMFFHQEKWLGGYSSFARRMYRLGHISFFGLGILNVLFYFTTKEIAVRGLLLATGSWSFVIGAATMPVCCVLMAHFPKSHFLFAIPVVSLLVGTIATLVLIIHL